MSEQQAMSSHVTRLHVIFTNPAANNIKCQYM